MLKNRIILVVVTIVMVAILFSLPKVVVNNEEGVTVSSRSSDTSTNPSGKIHDPQISDDEKMQVEVLLERFAEADKTKKNAIFADSLAHLFRDLSLFDSAAKYKEYKALNYPNEDSWIEAGDAFYEAQTFSQDPVAGEDFAVKARGYFQKVLELNSQNLEVKSKMAMTYVASANPMKGILMLREILETDAENELALFNLGILSLQSAQYDKAAQRFLKLIQVDPENLRAHFYLGVSYLEAGDKEKAKEEFELVKLKDKDPEVQANVDAYLNEIN